MGENQLPRVSPETLEVDVRLSFCKMFRRVFNEFATSV